MTTKVVEGVVQRLHEKSINTANGPSNVYSVLMNEGGDESWYSFGFKRPDVSNGQQVSFVVEKKGNYWNADPSSVTTVKTSDAVSPAVMKKAVNAVDDRQRSIVLQSAYERAIMLINGALANGAVKLPAKQADKFDTYCSLIEETALHLAEKFIDPPTSFAAKPDVVEDVTDVAPGPEGDEYAVV